MQQEHAALDGESNGHLDVQFAVYVGLRERLHRIDGVRLEILVGDD